MTFTVSERIHRNTAQHDAEELFSSAQTLLCRVASRPVDFAESLTSKRTLEAISALLRLDARAEQASSEMCDQIFAFVGTLVDKRQRNVLTQLRRDLFNRRPLTSAQLALAGLSEYSALREPLATYRDAIAAVEVQLRLIDQSFAEELAEARQRLQHLVGDQMFLRGLALSSSSLFHNVERFQRADPRKFGAREAQIERGLLRYFTRMTMKATPFGSFCMILPATLEVPPDCRSSHRQRLIGDVERVQSGARLNLRIYTLLWQHLRNNEAVRSALSVRAVPTLERGPEQYRYLAALAEGETFQRIARHPALDVIVSAVQAAETITFGELVGRLVATAALDTTRDEAVAFVSKLIDIGLLQPLAVVRDQEADWDVPLRGFLEGIDDDDARAAAALLSRLRQIVEDYVAADAHHRVAILAVANEQLATTCARFGIDAAGVRPILFEDITAAAVVTIPATDATQEALQMAGRLLKQLVRVGWSRCEQATMREFYRRQYGRKRSVPLLTFYEDYYRLSKKERDAALRSTEAAPAAVNPYRLPYVARTLDATEKLRALFVRRWQESGSAAEINVSAEEIASAVSGAPPLVSRSVSATQFCQIASGADGDRVIMKGWHAFAGYGKYFSRFLYLLPADLLASLRVRNRQLGVTLSAEICTDVHFNGDLHPQLLPHEISYPTGDATGGPHALAVTDLLVGPHPDDRHAVSLFLKTTGQPVSPVDLGFLNAARRPPLFKLLRAMSDVTGYQLVLPDLPTGPVDVVSGGNDRAMGAPTDSGNERGESRDVRRIVHRPRIVIGGSVVIGRRRWLIPSTLLPVRQPRETDSALFVRFTRWRLEADLPVEGYVTVRPMGPQTADQAVDGDDPLGDADAGTDEPMPGVGAVGAEEGAHSGGEKPVEKLQGARGVPWRSDNSKPQYIHFGSPLFLSLFERLGGALRLFILALEERYPARDALPSNGSGTFASELVVQYDFGDRRDVGVNEANPQPRSRRRTLT